MSSAVQLKQGICGATQDLAKVILTFSLTCPKSLHVLSFAQNQILRSTYLPFLPQPFIVHNSLTIILFLFIIQELQGQIP